MKEHFAIKLQSLCNKEWECKSPFRFQIPVQVANCFVFSRGVNVVPFLELVGLPDSIVSILKNSQSGNALTAYALYKVSVTIVCK